MSARLIELEVWEGPDGEQHFYDRASNRWYREPLAHRLKREQDRTAADQATRILELNLTGPVARLREVP